MADKRAACADDDTGPVLYYAHANFRSDFLEFVRTCYLEEMATARVAIEALSRSEDMFAGARDCISEPVESADLFSSSCVPYPACARSLDLEIDYNELIECLRCRGDLSQVTQRKSTIVFLPMDSEQSHPKGIHVVKMQVLQLAPLSAALFSLCDGKRSTSEIVREFHEQATVDDILAEKVCLFGLMELRKDGAIGISSRPLQTEADADPEGEKMPLAPWPALIPQKGHTQQPWPVS